jgi:hypothetical protein
MVIANLLQLVIFFLFFFKCIIVIIFAKFGIDTFPVKILRLIRNINRGNFDVYLSISNILNVTENLNTILEVDLPISNNVYTSKYLISDKSQKRRHVRLDIQIELKKTKLRKQ